MKEASKPSRIPIFLSAFIVPGAGQLMQRRWLSAVIFMTGFITCFVMFLVCAIKIILSFYGIAAEFSTYQQTELPVFRAVIYFLLAMLIYVISLIDTFHAYTCACTNWAKQKLRVPSGMGQRVSAKEETIAN